MSNRQQLGIAAVVPLLFVLAAPFGESGRACAPVARENAKVSIAGESAIIIWDEAAKTQHFIRRASFQTSAADFGFLVPTPTKPDVVEDSDASFGFLDEITKPKVVNRYTKDAANGMAKMDRALAAQGGAEVEVLENKRVGPFDMVILKAADAKELNDWLAKHGYQSSPELVKWFEPYIKSRWMVTAFKFASDAKHNFGLATTAVRMSFKTEKPFFPYSEPAAQKVENDQPHFMPPRLLRVYFIGTARMAGTLGDGAQPWPGSTAWANTLQPEHWTQVKTQLKMDGQPVPADAWLTIFEDYSSPRPGTADVFFEPSADQSTVKRPDIVNVIYDPDGTLAARAGVEMVNADEPNTTRLRVFILGGVGVLLLVAIGLVMLRSK